MYPNFMLIVFLCFVFKSINVQPVTITNVSIAHICKQFYYSNFPNLIPHPHTHTHTNKSKKQNTLIYEYINSHPLNFPPQFQMKSRIFVAVEYFIIIRHFQKCISLYMLNVGGFTKQSGNCITFNLF